MARDKKIIIGAINITIQPHSPEKYISLLRDAKKLAFPVKISGDQYGLLSGTHKLNNKNNELSPITGDIYKFTNINIKDKWFNVLTSDFADDTDIKNINIPENLKPNSSRFSYIFYPEEHLFFYEGYYDGNTLGAKSAERFISGLFEHKLIKEKYGNVDVTHVPATDALVHALNMPIKERIEIIVKRPNPDDHAEAERRVLERMKARNIEQYEEKYKAVSGEAIEMDKDMKTMAHVSAKNGSFYVKGKGSDYKPAEYSTKEHPLRETHYYDSSQQDVFQFFSTFTSTLKKSISQWFN